VIVVFGDARSETVAALKSGLATATQPYAAGVTVGERIPSLRSADDPQLPYVLVAVDGTPGVKYPIVAYSTVRVVVWHTNPDRANDLAQLCQGVLCSSSGDRLAHCAPATGPIPAVDPDGDIDMSWFTVTASMRGSDVSAD